MIFDLMNNSPEDKWLQFACAKELLDRGWGKSKEHLTVEPIENACSGAPNRRSCAPTFDRAESAAQQSHSTETD
jgi:hypothetical protein